MDSRRPEPEPVRRGQRAVQARGVYTRADREALLNIALEKTHCPALQEVSSGSSGRGVAGPPSTSEAAPLPGVQTLWELRAGPSSGGHAAACAAVVSVSQRLAEMAALMGAEAAQPAGESLQQISVADMLVREPLLLHVDYDTLARRLLHLRVTLSGRLDVAKLIEQQPSLLLEEAPRCVACCHGLLSPHQLRGAHVILECLQGWRR